jgi:hypothetical protein
VALAHGTQGTPKARFVEIAVKSRKRAQLLWAFWATAPLVGRAPSSDDPTTVVL